MSIGIHVIKVLACLFGLLLLFTSVEAHQRKEAYVTLLFNNQSGNLEVSHRFLLHDVNHALRTQFALEGDLQNNPETQSFFSSYLESRFLVANDGKPIDLSMVGYEVEGKYFWVYQERVLEDFKRLTVEHSALQEVWPAQVNHVNIEKAGQIRSARLSGESPRAMIDLSHIQLGSNS